MPLDPVQLDRARGALLASAAGDALGSQYEFGPALPDTVTPVFGVGSFGHEVYEWTDDTSMSVPILDTLASGERMEDPETRARIVERWIGWAETAKDVGTQTRAVLGLVPTPFTEDDVRRASREVHERTGRSGGNGALMRTGPLALGYLDRPEEELRAAARALSELTHWDPDSAAACMIWTTAIRHAVLTGELSVRVSDDVPGADRWRGHVDEASTPGAHPRDFEAQNGWVVRAFQGALAAVAGASSLQDALERAVRGGADTDTVAAIAGSLAGAVYGASAVPSSWRARLHGWPGYTAEDLLRQVDAAVR